MRFNLTLSESVQRVGRNWDVEQPVLVSGARCLEGETHAVGSPLSVEEQPLIGLELDQKNAAQVRDSEPAHERPVAELNRVVVLADQLEALLQFSG